MSRKAAARRASNARAYAFTPPSRTPKTPTGALPLTARLDAQIERLNLLRQQAVALNGDPDDTPFDYETKAANRKPKPRDLRHLVVEMLRERDGDRCYLCGKEPPLAPVVEHIIPLTHGGANEPHNIGLACYRCNVRKGLSYVAFSVDVRRPTYLYPKQDAGKIL